MKRRLFWLLALAGAIWLYLRRGARRPQPVESVPPDGDPAEELRRKLDETKDRAAGEAEAHLATPEAVTPEAVTPEAPHSEPAEPVEPESSAPVELGQPVVSEDMEAARRREVHERARTAADEMRGTSSD